MMPEPVTVIRAVDAHLPSGPAQVDIGIGSDGRIAALGEVGSLPGGQVVEADGLDAIPGGIDLHVHINTFFGGTTTRDDFFTGTAAALFGGTTTIAQFAIPRPDETSRVAIARTKSEAEPSAVSDYAVHGCIIRDTYDASLEQLETLRDGGVGTVKVFSAYTDTIGLTLGQIHRLLGHAAVAGVTVFVHAETDSLIREGVDAAVHAGELGPPGHSRSRTPLAENDAVRSLSDLALDTGATVYFVHVSSALSVATLGEHRSLGHRLLAETCPHYLFLDEAVYRRTDGERWICSPPIRSGEHRAALWEGLKSGVLDTVSSDHNCFDSSQKEAGRSDFRGVPNGLPGIEYRVPLLISAAIDGALGWERLVDVLATAPARLLGLWPRKGILSVGADADIVLLDRTGRTDLGTGHMATDYSPYEGLTVSGSIERVYRRGDLVVADGQLRAERGSGKWLPVTSPASPAAPSAGFARGC
jgi:dihydropyrimidinase